MSKLGSVGKGRRDYRLTGPDAKAAVAAGFDDADWYRAPIDPDRLSALTMRRNGRPVVDLLVWIALIVGFGALAFSVLGSWWAIPAFAAFGTLWGGSADARWHENGHGTVFRTSWLNDATYGLASFMMLREPTLWRWQHVRHHSSTQIVGLDPEVTIKRPTSVWFLALNYLNLVNGPKMIWQDPRPCDWLLRGLHPMVVPADQLRRVVWEARTFVLGLGATLAVAVELGTIVPLLFVGLPSFYGAWFMWFCAVTQHAGLREDVLDHRMSTRTVYINPIFRFLYLNMNYHLEHHMFPAVPYYNLPALHEEIKKYLPPPKTSMLEAYREILPAIRRQRRDLSWEIDRGWEAPPTVPTGRHGAVVRRRANSSGEVELGEAGMLSPESFTAVEIDGRSYVLCRTAEGDYALVDGICSHGRTRLSEGHFEACVIECPKHNGRFDVRSGEAVRLPATKPIAAYPVRVEFGRLVAVLLRSSLSLADGGDGEAR